MSPICIAGACARKCGLRDIIVANHFAFRHLMIKIMKISQHISLSIALLLFFSQAVVSQANVSDAKLMGIKGQVKSLVSSSKSISGYAEWVLKDKTKYQSTYVFDSKGNLTEMISEGGSNAKYIYSKIDGFKTFKTVELKSHENDRPRFTAAGSVEKPIEPNEKLTEPDKRFDFKHIYETDKNGRVISERQYKNNGKLFRKRAFEYDKAGVLTNESEEDSVAVMTYSYTYDDKGNVIEVNKTRDLKVPGTDSRDRIIIYSDYKFDSIGNWTERKITIYSKTDPMPHYKIPAQEYTLVSVEYRALTYY